MSIFAVELEHITKTFPGGVKANQDISLKIREGEVHGLLGENGAGKTTLMNILYGLISKDTGEIKIRGEEVDFNSPRDAISYGIGMVHQHFKLIPPLTVTENVILGVEPPLRDTSVQMGSIKPSLNPFLPINFKAAEKEIERIGKENGLIINPKAKVRELSVGLQQRVEIIKILYQKADILILDEPTAVLTPQEVDELFETLETFRESGKTIILITHKLREPIALCDRITVLRDGKLVRTVDKKDTSPEALAEMMVGRPVIFRHTKSKPNIGSSILSFKDLHVEDDRGLLAVKGISLDVRSGEILGLAGVHGNGQLELVEAIWGLRKPLRGDITIDGKRIEKFEPRRIRETGVGYIPQDRHNRGLILGFSVKENLILGGHYQQPYSTGPVNLFLNDRQISEYSNQLVDTYSIKITDLDAPTSTLSGGNQQKIIVARVLAADPKLIIASNPTRGLDVGAIEFIHRLLIKIRDQGRAIFLISSDLDEILHVADRIAVIYEGKIQAITTPEETNERELGLLMAGQQENQPS